MLSKNKKKSKILLTGGGTMGSVTPLLALVDAWRARGEDKEYLFVGTKTGPEYQAVDMASLQFKGISSGKFRRYWSGQNFKDLWNLKKGFWEALWLMIRWRPSVIITAGSFVSVPVVMAGWFLRIPIIVHQLDYQAGLANKIMAKFAKRVTTTLVKSLKDYGSKAIWIGSLLRQSILQPPTKERAWEFFGLHDELPVILVLGGGTGAVAINQLITNGLEDLTRYVQIIHLTGHDKYQDLEFTNYYAFNFLHDQDMAIALQAADLVICRAGMGTLTELSYLGKPTILIPMPKSHQELNAKAIQGAKGAIVLDEQKLISSELVNIIQEVIYNPKLMSQLSQNIQKAFKPNGTDKMLELIDKLIK